MGEGKRAETCERMGLIEHMILMEFMCRDVDKPLTHSPVSRPISLIGPIRCSDLEFLWQKKWVLYVPLTGEEASRDIRRLKNV